MRFRFIQRCRLYALTSLEPWRLASTNSTGNSTGTRQLLDRILDSYSTGARQARQARPRQRLDSRLDSASTAPRRSLDTARQLDIATRAQTRSVGRFGGKFLQSTVVTGAYRLPRLARAVRPARSADRARGRAGRRRRARAAPRTRRWGSSPARQLSACRPRPCSPLSPPCSPRTSVSMMVYLRGRAPKERASLRQEWFFAR